VKVKLKLEVFYFLARQDFWWSVMSDKSTNLTLQLEHW